MNIWPDTNMKSLCISNATVLGRRSPTRDAKGITRYAIPAPKFPYFCIVVGTAVTFFISFMLSPSSPSISEFSPVSPPASPLPPFTSSLSLKVSGVGECGFGCGYSKLSPGLSHCWPRSRWISFSSTANGPRGLSSPGNIKTGAVGGSPHSLFSLSVRQCA